MIVISVLNQKGGVGKTTVNFNIATVLAQKGYKTLMIDSDCQASLTLMTANDPLAIPKNICNIYDGTKHIKECIYKTPIDNLYIIPSSLALAKTETFLMSVNIGRERKIKKALAEIKDIYDFVLLDCPPALGLITINNLVASDYVVAPCEPTALSVYALDDLKDTVEDVKEINPKLKLLGVLINKYDKRIKKHTERIEELKSEFEIIGVIKSSVAAQKGIEEGIPAVISQPKSDVALAFVEATNKILEEIKNG